MFFIQILYLSDKEYRFNCLGSYQISDYHNRCSKILNIYPSSDLYNVIISLVGETYHHNTNNLCPCSHSLRFRWRWRGDIKTNLFFLLAFNPGMRAVLRNINRKMQPSENFGKTREMWIQFVYAQLITILKHFHKFLSQYFHIHTSRKIFERNNSAT